MGRRKGSHGAGGWHFPGGHLEYGEEPADCARREVLEETGLGIHDIRTGPYTNDVFVDEGKHYITLYLVAKTEGEPRLLEPEKCEGWQWVLWDEIPKPYFLPVKHLLEQGYNPF